MMIMLPPNLMYKGPMVVFLLGALSKAKCPYRINQFECIPCPEGGAIGGHFDFDSGVHTSINDLMMITLFFV